MGVRFTDMVRMVMALIAISVLSGFQVGARTVTLTLDEAVSRARIRSVDAAVAINELKSAYWEYRTFRADLLPEIVLRSTVPSYSKRFNAYQHSDGSYSFLRDDNLMISAELSLRQRIWLTGGTVSLTSSLDFMRQLSGDKSNRFMSVPAALKLEQPLFSVNTVKWDRKIEPVRYLEARAAYISATEQVAMTAIQYYFQLLSARENYFASQTNLANAERLYKVAEAKRRMGSISQNDLLQIELNVLNSQSALTECESGVRSAMFKLRSFLDYPDSVEIEPVDPEPLQMDKVNYADALSHALQLSSFTPNIRRRQLEADYEVAKAKGSMREINLFAQIGLTGTDRTFDGAYGHLRDNQIVEVGISLPLVDWGRRRGKVKTAESNRDVVRSRIRKEQADFNQNLYLLVERFNNQQGQLALSQRADTIARQRYDSSVETFMTGRISALDLNDSQTQKDASRAKYIDELFYFWYYYYQLRSVTLWDFTGRRPIDADFEAVINQ